MEKEEIIKKLVVKINGDGSGVICNNSNNNNKVYILTAEHCIVKKDNKVQYQIKQKKDKKNLSDDDLYLNLKIDEIITDKENDIAIIILDKSQFPNEIFNCKLRYLDMAYGDNVYFRGYPKIYENKIVTIGAKIVESDENIFTIEMKKRNENKEDDQDEIYTGFSGGGVFLEDGNEIFITGIICRLEDIKNTFDRIECCGLRNLNNLLGSKGYNEIKIEKNEIVRRRISQQMNIEILENQKKIILENIKDNINGYYLNRKDLIKEIRKKLIKENIVIITGEAMVGKSVLLKKLSEQLSVDSQVIGFSVDKFEETSLQAHLNKIGIKGTFSRILDDIAFECDNYIFIDGIEKAHSKRRIEILDEIIMSINETISSWKIVCTYRNSDLENIITRTKLSEYMIDSLFEVRLLNDKELQIIKSKFPILNSWKLKSNINNLIKIPLLIDLVLLSSKKSINGERTLWDTTFNIYPWFWKNIVKTSDICYEREDVLKYVTLRIIGDEYDELKLDRKAIDGLISDRIIRKEKKLTFVHDAFFDWTLAVILESSEDIVEFIKKHNESYYISEAFRLFCCKLIEIDNNIYTWIKIKNDIENANFMKPIWREIIFTAPLFCSNIKEFLKELKDENVIIDILISMNKYCIKINESSRGKKIEIISENWSPIIEFIASSDFRSEILMFEVTNILIIWIKWAKVGKIEEAISRKLEKYYQKTFVILSKDKILILKQNIIEYLIWSIEVLNPDIIERLKNYCKGNNLVFVRKLIAEGSWIPLERYCHDKIVGILEKVFCDEVSEDHNCKYGIRKMGWKVPTYYKGPFLDLLEMNDNYGIELICNMVNFATEKWKNEMETKNRKPLENEVLFEDISTKVFGDENVFFWYRYDYETSKEITSALMSLENWLINLTKENKNIKKYIKKLMQQTNSLAIIGVCCEVLCNNYEKYKNDIIEMFKNSVTLNILFSEKMDFEKKLDIAIFTRKLEKGDEYEFLRKISGKYSKINIVSVLISHEILEKKDCELLKCVEQVANTQQIFYLDKNEHADAVEMQLKKVFAKACQEYWKNDGLIIKDEYSLNNFYNYALDLFRSGHVKEEKLNKALEFAKELENKDSNEKKIKKFNLLFYDGDDKKIADALAGFAAGLVLRRWKWVEENNLEEWCTTQIIKSVSRNYYLDHRVNSTYDHIICGATALPMLYMYTHNNILLKYIYKIVNHQRLQVREATFNALQTCWDEGDLDIWRCIRGAIRKSMLIPIYKFGKEKFYKKEHKILNFISGKYNVSRLLLFWNYTDSLFNYITRYRYLASIQVINASYYYPILYCLPINENAYDGKFDKKLDYLLFQIARYTYNIYPLKRSNYISNFGLSLKDMWMDKFYTLLSTYVILYYQEFDKSKCIKYINELCVYDKVVLKNLLKYMINVAKNFQFDYSRSKFIDVWSQIGKTLMLKRDNTNQKLSEIDIQIYSLFIFIDIDKVGYFRDEVEWDIDRWTPVKRFIPFWSLWVEKVGYYDECFKSFLIFLTQQMKNIKYEFIIEWFLSIFQKDLGNIKFVESGNLNNNMEKIISYIWNEYIIDDDIELKEKIKLLLDIVSDRGLQIAAILKKKI